MSLVSTRVCVCARARVRVCVCVRVCRLQQLGVRGSWTVLITLKWWIYEIYSLTKISRLVVDDSKAKPWALQRGFRANFLARLLEVHDQHSGNCNKMRCKQIQWQTKLWRSTVLWMHVLWGRARWSSGCVTVLFTNLEDCPKFIRKKKLTFRLEHCVVMEDWLDIRQRLIYLTHCTCIPFDNNFFFSKVTNWTVQMSKWLPSKFIKLCINQKTATSLEEVMIRNRESLCWPGDKTVMNKTTTTKICM